jgi:hypothetical protein
VAHRDTIEDVHPLLRRMDLVAVEVCRPLLELGEVLDRPKASFRTVNLLIEETAKAGRSPR